jgi:hypothetical protein
MRAIAPMTKLVDRYPARHGLRRTLLSALRDRGDHEDMAVHLRALVQAGVASESERADLERIERGLPPRLRP